VKPWEKYSQSSGKPWEKYGAQTVDQPIDPTTDMSTGQRVAAGAGQALTDMALGLKQRLIEVAKYSGDGTAIGDPSIGPGVQAEVEAKRKLDAPLMATKGGSGGRILGNVAAAIPASFIPGANTYAGAALTGGLMGGLQPTAEGESAGMNTAQGAGYSIAGKGVADTLSAILRGGYQGIKSMAAPFYEGGRQKIAANTLRSFASNPDDVAARLAQAKEIIPGSAPTAADVAQDAGVSQLQRAVQASDPQISDDFAQRGLDRNSARLKAMKGVTKYGDDLEGAVERRSDIGAKLYEKAFNQTVKNDARLKEIAGRPAFKEAMRRAKSIAANEGKKVTVAKKGGALSTEGLHYIKMGFDDLINDAPTSGIGKAELNAIKQQRGEFVDWIAEKNPAYNTARTRFEKASRPINREEVVREITSKATRSQTPNVRGEMTIYPSSLGSTLKNDGEAVVRQATGRAGKTIPDVMTPDQTKILQNILKDASTEQAGVNFGRATGSNTAQNLASMNILRQTTGELGFPGIQGWAERNVFPSLARGMNLVYGGQEPLIRQSLAQILLDPQKAAQYLQMVPPQQRQLVTSELLKALPAATGSAMAVQ
jgi:hypothetical protein